MLTYIKTAIKRLPVLNEIVSERDKLHSELVALKKNLRFVPPGHFYSPIPSLDEVRRDETKIYGSLSPNISGLELYEEEQLKLLNRFVTY